MRALVAASLLTLLWGGIAAAQQGQSPFGQPGPSGAGPLNTPPMVVRVEQAAPFETASAAKAWWEPYVQPIISGVAALLGAVAGAYAATRNMTAANNQRANEMEIVQIQNRLNEFYSRFQMVSEENKLIALDFKKRQKSDDFRTLIALLDPGWRGGLSPADETIIKNIVANGVFLKGLIRDRAGLVDAQVLPYLVRVSAHFSMLELAYGGKLENDPRRFEVYVYPEKLDGVLELEIARLTARMGILQVQTDRRHGPMQPLRIPADLIL